MFIDVVSNVKSVNRIERALIADKAQTFERNLPDTLYLNQYELSLSFGYTPVDWNQFLKLRDVHYLIESEIAQITEAAARSAIQRLQQGEYNAQDISAAKELLANSKLLKQKQNQHAQVVLTRIAKGGDDSDIQTTGKISKREVS